MITAGRLAAPPVVSRPHLSAEQQAEKFPPRHSAAHWPAAVKGREEVLRMWIEATPRQEDPRNHDFRRRGLMLMLDWLAEQPGDTWHQRWHASGADAAGEQWADGPAQWLEQHGKLSRTRLETMTSSLVVMIGADVVRPSLAWLLTGGKKRKLARNMIRARDADGFARLDDFCRADDGISDMARRAALFRTAVIIAAKGGTVVDIVVGDLLEVLEVEAELRGQRRSGSATFRALRETGVFGAGVPTLREIRSIGQRPVEDLVDSYPVACRPIRDLLVEYLKERQPALDYGTLRGQTYQLVKCFWQDLELHHPGIDSLRLPADVAAAWKQRLRTRPTTTTTNSERVESVVERLSYQDILAGVRAFYLDLAQWALEEPGRWGSWVAPCPVSQQDLSRRKTTRRRKARMDARTRERLPVLPILVRSADQQRRDSEALLAAGRQAEPGQKFTAVGQSLTRIRRPHAKPANIWAEGPATGQRRLLNREEDNAFWAWAIIEVLRLTGVRAEEMLELSHHSLVQYRLPTTGEIVPLLQIAPSKTDTERLLVVSPELADVLSAIICRIRNADGAVPLVRARDYHELLWMPPAPLLFQRRVDTEPQRIARERVSSLLDEALARTGLIDQADGTPLHYTPHDFRRIFITDAILNGLPPHIAQVIAGHQDIAVTIGYKAVYPEETIKSHLAFLARRRSLRPSEEYRTPTDAEWQEFLGHFERRKVATGLCGRAFSTPCIHEHACLRCSMHWPDSDQRHRIEEIRDNLIARIAEAEREGWFGEVEGLQTSLAGANDKLAQIDRRSGVGSVDLPAPVLRSAGSTYTDTGRSKLGVD
ncbi:MULTISPECIES: tyrosine-type recombinase/integrase [Streptomyces]|uniref:Tyrosine-type recombinase/integrase n=2 Tax=Streptomyces TaxID=1883 RepID=A0ABV9J9B3_9ACTN